MICTLVIKIAIPSWVCVETSSPWSKVIGLVASMLFESRRSFRFEMPVINSCTVRIWQHRAIWKHPRKMRWHRRMNSHVGVNARRWVVEIRRHAHKACRGWRRRRIGSSQWYIGLKNVIWFNQRKTKKIINILTGGNREGSIGGGFAGLNIDGFIGIAEGERNWPANGWCGSVGEVGAWLNGGGGWLNRGGGCDTSMRTGCWIIDGCKGAPKGGIPGGPDLETWRGSASGAGGTYGFGAMSAGGAEVGCCWWSMRYRRIRLVSSKHPSTEQQRE